MNVGVAHSEENPNSSWLNSRGGWMSYLLGIGLLHVILRSVPVLDAPCVWTLTNVIHNAIVYVVLHTLKGAPWENADQGKSRRLTHWEQIDNGEQFTETRKFLTVVPIVLFIVTSHFTGYEWTHFLVNTVALLFVLLPKLPQFHKLRIFDINKY